MSPVSERPIRILMVEDNPGDVRLTREALRDAKVRNALSVVGDGEAALNYLRQRGEFSDAERPDLVLLDLNLPRLDGREVLSEIRGDPTLASIPVVVMTTSADEKDVLQSYALHANCYVTKPIDLRQFVEVVQAIEQFWLTVVTLPTARV